jgi:hypothetical protein
MADQKKPKSRLRRALELGAEKVGVRQPDTTQKFDDLDDWLKDAIERIDDGWRREETNIAAAYEDLEFRAGEHWPDYAKREREHEKRPIITINDVPQFVRQITGDIRLMKPSIKVIPVDARADEAVAKLLSGMIRYIENRSHAKVAYAIGADSQAAAGVGHWRVLTEYASATTMNQEIRIAHIEDGVSVLWDADAMLPTREDAMWCLVPVDLTERKFKQKYPDVPLEEFAHYGRRFSDYWHHDNRYRVGEFWEKRPAKRKLAVYPNGAAHDVTKADDAAIKKCTDEGAEVHERDGFKVYRALITLGHVLEEPEEWPGEYIPIIRAAGEEVRIGRNIVRHGVVRFMKDPCRLYNYARSAQAEVFGLAPKSPWLGTDKNFEDFEEEWETANEQNWPYLRYKPDPANGGAAPQRNQPPVSSPGLSEAVALAGTDKQRVTGIYPSSLGAPSPETSGVAIRTREQQSDVGNVVYIENFALAVAHTGKVILDLIPHVYDHERVVQIQDEKGEVQNVTINRAVVSDQLAPEPVEPIDEDYDDDEDTAPDTTYDHGDDDGGEPDASIDTDPAGTKQAGVSPDIDTGDAYENDVTIGTYAIEFDTGPAYSTRREEAQAGMAELLKSVPQIVPIILDLYVKAQDWPMASEIAERLQAMLPPPIQAQIALERARASGQPLPPQAMPPMPPPGPPGGPPMGPHGPVPMPPPGAPHPPGPPPPEPPSPKDVADAHVAIAKAQSAEAIARLDVEKAAIMRDIAALELRIATAKAGGDQGAQGSVIQGLVEEMAHIHGMVAELVAAIHGPKDIGDADASAPGGPADGAGPGAAPVPQDNLGAPAPAPEGA